MKEILTETKQKIKNIICRSFSINPIYVEEELKRINSDNIKEVIEEVLNNYLKEKYNTHKKFYYMEIEIQTILGADYGMFIGDNTENDRHIYKTDLILEEEKRKINILVEYDVLGLEDRNSFLFSLEDTNAKFKKLTIL